MSFRDLIPTSRPQQYASPAVLLVAIVSMILAGCTGSPGKWSVERRPSEPQVQSTDYRHSVAFGFGRAVPSRAEEAALRQFVTGLATGPDDRVSVLAAAPRPGDQPQEDLLARQRQAAVLRVLAELGIRAEKVRTSAENLQPGSPVTVLVQRTTVTLPECPNWTGDPRWNINNRPLRNWSCATAVNLGLMLADPNDLVHGRTPGYADGEYLARSVESYRKGRTRDLIRDVASGELFPAVAPSSSSNGN